MDNRAFDIQWIQQFDGIKNSKEFLVTNVEHSVDASSETALLVSNGNEENEVLQNERSYLLNMVDDASETSEQVAAENLMFMARDGQIEEDLITATTDVHGALVVSASDGATIIMQPANCSSFIEVYDETTPELVTEEVITDDWVQSQGEDRVEVSAEEIIGSGARLILDMEVPLPTVQDEYTAQRPYPCDFCSRRFRKKTSLMNHMIAHKTDRPHICQLCDCRFFRRNDLINHLKAHPDLEVDKPAYIKIVDDSEKSPDAQVNVQEIINESNDSHFYEENWSIKDVLATTQRTVKSVKTKSSQSISSSSNNNLLTPPRGRTSRLKLSKDSYVLEQSEQQSFVSEQQPIEYQSQLEEKIVEDATNTNLFYPVIDESKPFVCQTCGRAFAREKALKSHMTNHNNDISHECNQCNEIFWDEASLQDHQKTHQFDESSSEYEPVEADEDQSDSDTEQKLFGNFYCSECGMCFHRQDLLRRHMKTHEKTQKSSNDLLMGNQNQHCCSTCGETFDAALDLLAHAEIHARYSPYKCVLCGESFYEESTIKLHLHSQHPTDMTANSCVLCGKSCRDNKALIKHAWDHTREKRYSCSKCGKNFHNRARLNRHMTSHRDKSVACDICQEEFPDGRTLSNHRHSHSVNANAGKLFPCGQCGKTFGSRSSQQIHVRIHTGERPYGCRFCWKAFADGGTLRKHERIHTGEKPYACSVCPRAFNQRVVLREHIRSHHSGLDIKRGTYHCSVCLMDLNSSPELMQHLIQHSDTNTAKQRQPITGPRKYKRRRKLKPHELERLRTESKQDSNGSDIYMSDIDISTVDELLDITSSNSRNSSRKRQRKKAKASVDRISSKSSLIVVNSDMEQQLEEMEPEDLKVTLQKSNNSIKAMNQRQDCKLVMTNMQNHLHDIDSLMGETKNTKYQRNQKHSKQVECTAQRTQQVQLGKSQLAATGNRRRQDKSALQRPRMIHTERTKSVNSATNGNKRHKSRITRTEHANIDLLSKSSSSSSSTNNMIDDHEIISPATQPPNQISQSPLYVKQEPSILYDAQLLLEASALRSKVYERFNPNIVNDLEEILRSPIKSDRCRFTSESSDKFIVDQPDGAQHFIKIESTSPDLRELVGVAGSSDERRSTRKRQITANRNLIGFELDASSIIGSGSRSNNHKIHAATKRDSAYSSGKGTPTTAAISSESRRRNGHATSQLNFSIDANSYANIVSNGVGSANGNQLSTDATSTTTHTAARKIRYFECEMCSEVFTDRAQLLDHVPIHI